LINIFKSGFFIRNKILLSLYFIIIFSVFSFVPLLNMLLIEYYYFSEKDIAYISSFAVIGFIFSSILNTHFWNIKVNFIKILNIMISLSILVFTSLGLALYLDLGTTILSIIRFLDGIITVIIISTIAHIWKFKLIKNPHKSDINSIITSINYIIKIVLPLIIAPLISFFILPELPFIITILALIFGLILLNIHKKMIYYKYMRYFYKEGQKDIKKKNLGKDAYHFFFGNHRVIEKYIFISSTIIQSLIRPFYDLVIPAILLLNYKYSLSESAILVSFMVIGQSLQYFTNIPLRKISLHYYQITQISLLTLVSFSILKLDLNLYLLSFLLFSLGLIRSMFANWDFVYQTNLVDSKNSLQNVIFINRVLGETVHFFAYLSLPLFLCIEGDYSLYTIFFLSIMLFLILITIYLEKKKNSNKI